MFIGIVAKMRRRHSCSVFSPQWSTQALLGIVDLMRLSCLLRVVTNFQGFQQGVFPALLGDATDWTWDLLKVKSVFSHCAKPLPERRIMEEVLFLNRCTRKSFQVFKKGVKVYKAKSHQTIRTMKGNQPSNKTNRVTSEKMNNVNCSETTLILVLLRKWKRSLTDREGKWSVAGITLLISGK